MRYPRTLVALVSAAALTASGPVTAVATASASAHHKHPRKCAAYKTVKGKKTGQYVKRCVRYR